MEKPQKGINLMRLTRIKGKVGLGKTTINEMVKRGEFPKPIQIGARAVAWLESDVDEWIESRVKAAGDAV